MAGEAESSEPQHIEASLFAKAFSLVVALIAVTFFGAIIAFVLVAANKWFRYKYSIFGLCWGLCARLLDLSVRRGIEQSIADPHLTIAKRKIRGEQLAMLRITRWFVRIEMSVSVAVLLTEIITG